MHASGLSLPRQSSGFNLQNISYESRARMEAPAESPTPPKRRAPRSKNVLLVALQKSLHSNCFATGQANGFSTGQLDKIGRKMFHSIVKDPGLVCGQILRNELQTEVARNREEESRHKVPSGFCLVKVLRSGGDFSRYKEYLDPAILRTKRLSKASKHESIRNYLRKKERRKKNTSIRYQIRKDLAIKRKRHKGKFIKSSKIDLKKAVELYNEKELSKGLSQLNLNANQ